MSREAQILFVDDESAYLQTLRRLFRNEPIRVDYASNADDAIELCHKTSYDVVFSDVKMPGKGGIELLLELTKVLPSMGIVLMTAMPKMDAAIECMKFGANDYLTKPLTKERVLTCIAECMEINSSKKQYELHYIGDYAILEMIGEGAYSCVFKAKRISDGKGLYAVKVLRSGFCSIDNTNAYKRFIRESKVLSQIKHRNVISLVDFGFSVKDNIPYLVMEYLEGKTLDYYMNDKSISLLTKVDWMLQLAEGLNAVHESGLCHRDLSPKNLFIADDGTVKILDFGMVKVQDSQLTASQVILGTPAYMSPESFDSKKETDEHSDMFSLGSIFYEMITLKLPFEGMNIKQLAARIISYEPKEMEKLSSIPHRLADVIHRMMEKTPVKRYHTIANVVDELSSIIEGKH
ncbi:MAG: protein kinase [Lentisphaeria bacterium]|nr:protein kinase [Lentisphaeria bacterium]NQZ66784.1 protein kinase [Lentisphaeria bacterium]